MNTAAIYTIPYSKSYGLCWIYLSSHFVTIGSITQLDVWNTDSTTVIFTSSGVISLGSAHLAQYFPPGATSTADLFFVSSLESFTSALEYYKISGLNLNGVCATGCSKCVGTT